jgi:hypothetical protein
VGPTGPSSYATDAGSLTLNWADPHRLVAGAPSTGGGRQLAAYNPVSGSFVVARRGLASPAFPAF